jgi:signal transduction histidine kinase
MKGIPKAIFLLYILLGYVIAQFVWWAYLIYDLNAQIIDLNNQISPGAISIQNEVRNKLFMILGEGSVFLTLLLIGAFYIRKFVLREQKLARQERNFLLATTHEFNSPIAAIKLNLQTLQKRTLSEEQYKSILGSALGANQRLELLVSNILTASRLDAGRFELHQEEVEMTRIFQNLLNRFKLIAAESGSELKFNFQDDIIVWSDSSALELMTGNLIENALKYAPHSLVLIEAKRVNDMVEISVADNGPGIPKDEWGQVFRKFYRVENEETRSQKGTGLGLYLVQQLADLHGASVELKANAPKGCIFTITVKGIENA